MALSKPEKDRDKWENVHWENNVSYSHLTDVGVLKLFFGRLTSSVTNQLDRNGVSLEDITTVLEIDLNSPEYMDDGERISDVYTFFSFLATTGYMPFYSLDMLETVIEKFAPECHQSLEEYKMRHLRPFLLKNLHEIDMNCFKHQKIPGQVKLVIKFDQDWHTTSLLDLEKLTKSLAAIINIPHEQLVIETAKKGSVILECRIPRRSAVVHVSLTDSQQKELKELSVKKLVCDGLTLLDAVDSERSTHLQLNLEMLTESTTSHCKYLCLALAFMCLVVFLTSASISGCTRLHDCQTNTSTLQIGSVLHLNLAILREVKPGDAFFSSVRFSLRRPIRFSLRRPIRFSLRRPIRFSLRRSIRFSLRRSIFVPHENTSRKTRMLVSYDYQSANISQLFTLNIVRTIVILSTFSNDTLVNTVNKTVLSTVLKNSRLLEMYLAIFYFCLFTFLNNICMFIFRKIDGLFMLLKSTNVSILLDATQATFFNSSFAFSNGLLFSNMDTDTYIGVLICYTMALVMFLSIGILSIAELGGTILIQLQRTQRHFKKKFLNFFNWNYTHNLHTKNSCMGNGHVLTIITCTEMNWDEKLQSGVVSMLAYIWNHFFWSRSTHCPIINDMLICGYIFTKLKNGRACCDGHLRRVTSKVKKWKPCCTLRLGSNNIGDDGAGYISEGLKHCPKLQTLEDTEVIV